MSTISKLAATLLLVAVLLSAQECPKLAVTPQNLDVSPSIDEAIRYLEGNRDELTGDCVLVSLWRIGTNKDARALNIAIKYLDWMNPRYESLRKTGIHLGGAIYEPYPAVSTLFEIGKEAIDPLVQVAGGNGSDVVRRNAVTALTYIFRSAPEESVATLARASKATTDPTIERKLTEAAKWAAERCGVSRKRRCESALPAH